MLALRAFLFSDFSIFTHNKGSRPLDFISALLSRSDSSEKDRHYFDSLESTSISGIDMLPPELSAHWVLFRSRKNVCYFENARAEIFFLICSFICNSNTYTSITLIFTLTIYLLTLTLPIHAIHFNAILKQGLQ